MSGGTYSWTTSNSYTPVIGSIYQGGILFDYDSTTQTGLLSSIDDIGTNGWGCAGTFIGGTASSIGTGQANTTAILNGCSNTFWGLGSGIM